MWEPLFENWLSLTIYLRYFKPDYLAGDPATSHKILVWSHFLTKYFAGRRNFEWTETNRQVLTRSEDESLACRSYLLNDQRFKVAAELRVRAMEIQEKYWFEQKELVGSCR